MLRYGEPWRDTVGDKFIYCMAAEIENLRKQRDDMLAAFEKFMDSHEECTDFDGFTAQIVSMDDYHEAQEAITSVKDKK